MAKKATVKQENPIDLKFSVLGSEERTVPDIVEKKTRGGEYVYYGEDNKFPSYLFDLYIKSSVLQSVINGTTDFIAGNGIVLNDSLMRFEEEVNKDGDTMEDLVKKVALDYMVFGGFAIQVLYNRENAISELYWLDMRNVRTNEDETKIFYSNSWGSYGSKMVEYKKWEPGKMRSSSVFYYKGHITRGVYPIPRYSGALAAIETSTEIGRYHLNNILNGMSNGVIINFNNGIPSESEKKQIEKRVNEKLAGAGNAGRTIISFNDNKDSATDIQGFPEDKRDEKFKELYQSTMKEIFVAFRATPALFGLNPENQGFSKTEFMEAFSLYNKTVVKPCQKDIQRAFDKIFDIDNSLLLNPFKLEDAENKEIE